MLQFLSQNSQDPSQAGPSTQNSSDLHGFLSLLLSFHPRLCTYNGRMILNVSFL